MPCFGGVIVSVYLFEAHHDSENSSNEKCLDFGAESGETHLGPKFWEGVDLPG